ncbi:MAG: PucR family transcriptional regulator [Candidatus Nanopelagicales bacterium]
MNDGRAQSAGESKVVVGAARLQLDPRIAGRLAAALPQVAEGTIAAVMAEVPTYAGALTGRTGANVTRGVDLALGSFLALMSATDGTDPSAPLAPAMDAAYRLGREEARYGRSADALLAAFRIGARVAWRELSDMAVAEGIDVGSLAAFAELVFAYIDELSAASLAGHGYEMATSDRARQRRLDLLAEDLIRGAAVEHLQVSAERAQWPVPRTLTAVLLPPWHLISVRPSLSRQTLTLEDDLPGLADVDERALLLIPEAEGSGRPRLAKLLRNHEAVLGPARPWDRVVESYQRAVAAVRVGITPAVPGGLIDTEDHLARLIVSSDLGRIADLRAELLRPLAELPPATAQRLADTLRSWVLHRGDRSAVARDLAVHPQTVRYRMGQIRELYGPRLNDPRTTIDVVVALAYPS